MTHRGTTMFLLSLVLCLITAVSAWAQETENARTVQIKILFVVEDSAKAALEQKGGVTPHLAKVKDKLNTLLLKSGLGDHLSFIYCDTHASFNAEISESAASPEAIFLHTLKKYKAEGGPRENADLVVIFVDRKTESSADTLGLSMHHYDFAAYERPFTGSLAETEQELRHRQQTIENAGYVCCVGVDSAIDIYNTVSHEVGHLLGAGHPGKPHPQPGPQANMEAAGIDGSVMSYKRYNAGSDWGNMFSNEGICNNSETVKNFAHVVARFRKDGNEPILNSTPDCALRLPFARTMKDVYEAYGLTPELLGKYSPELLPDAEAGESDKRTYISWIIGTNDVAQQPGDKAPPRVNGGTGKTAWYEYTARTNGPCSVLVRKTNTKEGFAPVLAVFKNTDSGLQEADYLNDDRELPTGFLAEKQLYLTAGEKVYIAVDCVGKPAKYFFLMVKQTAPQQTNTRSICTYGALGVGVLSAILFFFTGNKKQHKEKRLVSEPRRHPLPPAPPARPRTYTHLRIKGKWSSKEQGIVETSIPLEELRKDGGYSIGRNCDENDLSFPHKSVSGRHITLSYGQDANGSYLSITALDATYGTMVNGVRLQAHETVRLTRSADVNIGSGIFIFRLE